MNNYLKKKNEMNKTELNEYTKYKCMKLNAFTN